VGTETKGNHSLKKKRGRREGEEGGITELEIKDCERKNFVVGKKVKYKSLTKKIDIRGGTNVMRLYNSKRNWSKEQVNCGVSVRPLVGVVFGKAESRGKRDSLNGQQRHTSKQPQERR